MASEARQDELGEVVGPDEGRVLVGTCSWTDKTLTDETEWYPARTMSAADRLAFYAARFPVAEIDSTYYGPPREQQAALWAERTPPGFRFDVKAFSLLTGHPTKPKSLWRDLRDELPEEVVGKRNLYAKDLPPELLDEAWRRFGAALRPLHEAGKLGAILFQYPAWFGPRKENREIVRALRERLPDYRLSVEFRSPRWTAEARDRERTLELLERQGLVFVGVDAPEASKLPRVVAATTRDLAIVRFHGRGEDGWANTRGTAADRFNYLYSDAELEDLAERVTGLTEEARETHLLMNNCYRDNGVRNAWRLRELIAERLQ